MPALDRLEHNHRQRSNFVRALVQQPVACVTPFCESASTPPRRIVQFWDDISRLPDDVAACIDTWRAAERQGFERVLFDSDNARQYIADNFGERHLRAYTRCYHPAMQSDYFRLCYIFAEGGCYIDADDIFHDVPIQGICSDGRLRIQPLCYDMANNRMVPSASFILPGADSMDWIFYFNNNPMVAARGHPLIGLALAQATLSLEQAVTSELPEIQSTAGPGNLTKVIFDSSTDNNAVGESIAVLHDWEKIATSKWPLSYRNDARNWRLSNGRAYRPVSYSSI